MKKAMTTRYYAYEYLKKRRFCQIQEEPAPAPKPPTVVAKPESKPPVVKKEVEEKKEMDMNSRPLKKRKIDYEKLIAELPSVKV